MIFAEQISRPIGKADLEFYESGLVLRMALILSGYSENRWNTLSAKARNRWLDRAVNATHRLFNDSEVAKKLPVGGKSS